MKKISFLWPAAFVLICMLSLGVTGVFTANPNPAPFTANMLDPNEVILAMHRAPATQNLHFGNGSGELRTANGQVLTAFTAATPRAATIDTGGAPGDLHGWTMTSSAGGLPRHVVVLFAEECPATFLSAGLNGHDTFQGSTGNVDSNLLNGAAEPTVRGATLVATALNDYSFGVAADTDPIDRIINVKTDTNNNCQLQDSTVCTTCTKQAWNVIPSIGPNVDGIVTGQATATYLDESAVANNRVSNAPTGLPYPDIVGSAIANVTWGQTADNVIVHPLIVAASADSSGSPIVQCAWPPAWSSTA